MQSSYTHICLRFKQVVPPHSLQVVLQGLRWTQGVLADLCSLGSLVQEVISHPREFAGLGMRVHRDSG